jgi:hypothetical protein
MPELFGIEWVWYHGTYFTSAMLHCCPKQPTNDDDTLISERSTIAQTKTRSSYNSFFKMNPLTSVLAILLASVGLIASFQISIIPRHSSRHIATMSPLQMTELSPIDEMCIENVAEFCLHESCDVDEYEALVNQLEEQRDHFIRHVANVESLLQRLKNSNHPEHDPAEVNKLIADIKVTLAAKP